MRFLILHDGLTEIAFNVDNLTGWEYNPYVSLTLRFSTGEEEIIPSPAADRIVRSLEKEFLWKKL